MLENNILFLKKLYFLNIIISYIILLILKYINKILYSYK